MGMGFALGIYLTIICMVIAIGARMECGPRVGENWGCVRYGYGQGEATAMR
jgi:hypothetical protein